MNVTCFFGLAKRSEFRLKQVFRVTCCEAELELKLLDCIPKDATMSLFSTDLVEVGSGVRSSCCSSSRTQCGVDVASQPLLVLWVAVIRWLGSSRTNQSTLGEIFPCPHLLLRHISSSQHQSMHCNPG